MVRFILGESINLIRDEVDLVFLTKGKQILDGLWRLLVLLDTVQEMAGRYSHSTSPVDCEDYNIGVSH